MHGAVSMRQTDHSKSSQLALALHPDKNGAPGADEAFKCALILFSPLMTEYIMQTYFSGLKSFPSAIRYFSATPFYLLNLSAALQTHKNVLYMTAVGLIQRIDLVACLQGRQASLHHRLVTVMAN